MNDFFESNGIRNTAQRRKILAVLESSCVPVTAFDLYDALGGEINASTIYRTLELFTEKGILRKNTPFDGGTAAYEMNTADHKHILTCSVCGASAYFESCPIAEFEQTIESQTGYKIKTHRLELTGLCGKCRAKTDGNQR